MAFNMKKKKYVVEYYDKSEPFKEKRWNTSTFLVRDSTGNLLKQTEDIDMAKKEREHLKSIGWKRVRVREI